MTVTHVPLLDLRRDVTEIDAELEDAFRRVLRSGHYILGPEVEGLERECAEYLGVKHALAVSSGTDALLLALMVLGIGPGDEVICPTYTFFATAGVVWRVGAKPVLVDVRPCCLNVSPEAVAAAVTKRTKAIVPVHLFGQCAVMTPLLEVSRSAGIPIVEDAAQAIGARFRGEMAGTMGDMGAFSFFPSKNVGALGDAGLLVTNDDDLAERARRMRAHGGKPKYFHDVVGGNFRMDALQAAFLRVKMRRLEGSTARRRHNAGLYNRLFVEAAIGQPAPSACAGGIQQAVEARPALLLPPECQESHIYNQYIVRVTGAGRRDELIAFLRDRKVGTEVYYPLPMHLQKCFASLGHAEGDFPIAEAAARETLALPIFPELREEEIAYVVDQVSAFFRREANP